jgi:hypothetical protein
MRRRPFLKRHRATILKAVRVFVQSVLLCAGATAAYSLVVEPSRSTWWADRVVETSALFGVTFATVAAVVLLPGFLLVDRLTGGAINRWIALAAGGVVAPALCLVLAVTWFGNPGDPTSPSAWLAFWFSHIGQVLLSVMPFILAGAAFGYFWAVSPGAPAAGGGR